MYTVYEMVIELSNRLFGTTIYSNIPSSIISYKRYNLYYTTYFHNSNKHFGYH